MKHVLTALIRAYQLFLSPLMGRHCRFEPSCSRYAIEAIDRHGAWRGSWLAMRRIGRCHPWCERGIRSGTLNRYHSPMPAPSSTSRLIRNARLVNEGEVREADLLIEDGRIARIDNDLHSGTARR